MRYLFIDTNVYMTCLLMRQSGHTPAILNRVRKLNQKAGGLLLVPEVVDAELQRHLKESPQYPTVTSLFAADGVTHVPLTPTALTRAMVWSIRAERPAKVSEEERSAALEALDEGRFKYGAEQDCLILSTLSEFMQGKTYDTLVFCTRDKKWYSDGGITPTITSVFDCELAAYRDITSLLDEEFGHEVKDELKAEELKAAESLEALRQTISVAVNIPAFPKPVVPHVVFENPAAAAVAKIQADSKARMAALTNITSPIQTALSATAATRLYGVGSPMSQMIREMNERNAQWMKLATEFTEDDDEDESETEVDTSEGADS